LTQTCFSFCLTAQIWALRTLNFITKNFSLVLISKYLLK
jgi:hypothetical protein